VVTHQSAAVVGGLLDSLELLDPRAVVVVDHESTDGTPDILAGWRPPYAAEVLRRPNRGYAAGVNAALAALSARGIELVAVLNPDARIVAADPDGLRRLFASRPRLGSACPLTLAADGRHLDTLGLRLTPWAAVADHGQGRPATWTGTGAIRGVIGPCGGSALYRMSALRAMDGPFDERFFLYFEDADLALRLAARGWSTVTTDLLTVQHGRAGLGGRSGDLGSSAARLATRERQRSYELFVSGPAPLPAATRLAGRAAARLRGRMVRRRLRDCGVGHP
jgi:N-acetylglucosaminyl-diphospho-decaprenol L-rhamnosyltransferase